MRRARKTRDRLTHVRGHDLGTLSKGPVRKDFSGELKEVGPKIGEGATIKTLAAARTGEMEKIKDELRAMLPILKPSEVKRFRLPLHEAIVDELEEGNYEESVRYLKELFELDEAIRREAGPGTLTWEKPRLKNTRDAMLRLKESLIAVERAKNAGKYEVQSTRASTNIVNFLDIGDCVSMAAEFLNTALYFQAMTWEWWWVTERLYRSALENAKLIEGDDERMSTFAHYLYGRFLFEQMQDTVQSLYHLKVAREASQEKSWNASKMTGRKEETIFRECNVLLYKALLMYAQQVGPDQPDVAVKAYTEALARATDCKQLFKDKKDEDENKMRQKLVAISPVISTAGHYENSANVLYELGMSQLRSGDVKLAYRNFSKFLAMAKRISNPEGICNAHMAMALAYKLRVYKRILFPCHGKRRTSFDLYFSVTRASFDAILISKKMPIFDTTLTDDSRLQELGDDANTEKHLSLFMINATESGLMKKLAQAHCCTGEYFLSKRRPDIATFYLEKSFELYNELGLCNDADKARALAGVSKGELHFFKTKTITDLRRI
ncbi:uncharacterized protein LOC112454005 [Temnothorax curvispinosus]|uniref:Tetratricopeptide repeat protein 29 n=1 Tax=Temnothorax curvispinosus TaxID=300111 RepID=A0A6J1PNI7_9HYME|nr:uncharacterized protein LOC112454005 [Temnothorax curvispinosus]